jgi:hypothetical protein
MKRTPSPMSARAVCSSGSSGADTACAEGDTAARATVLRPRTAVVRSTTRVLATSARASVVSLESNPAGRYPAAQSPAQKESYYQGFPAVQGKSRRGPRTSVRAPCRQALRRWAQALQRRPVPGAADRLLPVPGLRTPARQARLREPRRVSEAWLVWTAFRNQLTLALINVLHKELPHSGAGYPRLCKSQRKSLK